jgi:hypothetical protein
MLEAGGTLRTWALSANPLAGDDWDSVVEEAALEDREIIAEPLPDHRLAYLEYEGPLSAGRGKVARIEAGEYEVLSETNFELRLELSGQQLTGQWSLCRANPTSSSQWVLRRI